MQAIVNKLFFSSWSKLEQPLSDGYTLLMPIPYDLPVLLDLSVRVAEYLNDENLREILVIPDYPTQEFRDCYHKIVKQKPLYRLLEMPHTHKLVGRLINRPGVYHFLQIFNGVNQARSKYCYLHDADAILVMKDFVENQYLVSEKEQYSVLGAELPRDNQLRLDGGTVVATWEMMARTDWYRRFPPYLHKSHTDQWEGKMRSFDTTIYPQWLTDTKEIGLDCNERNLSSGFVHVPYTVSTFRKFKGVSGPYEDKYCNLLFLRVLIDVLEMSDYDHQIPVYEDLLKGIKMEDALVTYTSDIARKWFYITRDRMNYLLTTNFFNDRESKLIQNYLERFEKEIAL
jgi:hypothetical protein